MSSSTNNIIHTGDSSVADSKDYKKIPCSYCNSGNVYGDIHFYICGDCLTKAWDGNDLPPLCPSCRIVRIYTTQSPPLTEICHICKPLPQVE